MYVTYVPLILLDKEFIVRRPSALRAQRKHGVCLIRITLTNNVRIPTIRNG